MKTLEGTQTIKRLITNNPEWHKYIHHRTEAGRQSPFTLLGGIDPLIAIDNTLAWSVCLSQACISLKKNEMTFGIRLAASRPNIIFDNGFCPPRE